jgi:hypothetical protein
MADYKEKIEEWQQAALRKAKELDERKPSLKARRNCGPKLKIDYLRKTLVRVHGRLQLMPFVEQRRLVTLSRALQVRRARKLAWSSMKRRPTTTAPRILLIVARSLLVLQPPQLLDY